MKNNNYKKNIAGMIITKYCLCFMLTGCSLFCNSVSAASVFYKTTKYTIPEKSFTDTEKKVDYIERIYFSGKNKSDLNNMILATVQGIEEKPATKAVARQYVFLAGIESKANSAKNACEVEELLAAGIYGIDVVEAINQNIPKPSPQATTNAGDALANVNNLNSSTTNLNSSVYTLSNGSYSAGKVGSVTTKVGSGFQTLSAGTQVTDQVGKTLKSLGLHKDRPCSSVPQKDIAIGQHLLPDTSKNAGVAAAGTKIIIKNINYNQLSAVASIIQKIDGVSSVNSDDFSNNSATILVVYNMKLKDLVNKILQSNSGINFNVESLSAHSATLAIK
jgi:hypothetical protein